jgi:hypothetical protein
MVVAAACRRPPEVAVAITMPAEGDTVRGSAVHVMLAVTGIELAPGAEQRPGTAHHHLYLDVDPAPPGEVIPIGRPRVIHLGMAQTEFHWDSVPPGPHRIIAVLGDPAHVPIARAAADTVTFLVAP